MIFLILYLFYITAGIWLLWWYTREWKHGVPLMAVLMFIVLWPVLMAYELVAWVARRLK